MMFEQKVKMTGLGLLAAIAALVFAAGTTKAVQGTAIYMESAEGHSTIDALIYAGMIAGAAILLSNMAVFLQHRLGRVACSAAAVCLACLTVYTTHAGKAYDSDAKIDTSRAPERNRIIAEANEYQENIKRLSGSLAKNIESGASTVGLPTVADCDRFSKNYTRCNANRTKQIEANTKLLQASGTGAETLQKAIETAQTDKQLADSRLAAFDTQTNALKTAKRHDSLLTNAVSAVMPELASLLGSFSLGFFLNAMYLIIREKHPLQLASQCVAVGVAVPSSDLQQSGLAMTHLKIKQWSVLPEMSKIQQTAKTPQGAEEEFAAAIDAKLAPLSTRSAKAAYPLISFRRISEIFDEKFVRKVLNCRIDAKGNNNYEYPAEGEEGGHTFYTETAKARLASPPQRGIYLATSNGGVIA